MDRQTFATSSVSEAVARCSAVWSAHRITRRGAGDFGIDFDCAPINRDLSVTQLGFPSGAQVVPWARAQVTIVPIVHSGEVTITTGRTRHVIGQGRIGAIDVHSASRVEYSEAFRATVIRISNDRIARYANRITSKGASSGITFHGSSAAETESIWSPLLHMTTDISVCAQMKENTRLAGHFEEMIFSTLLSGLPNTHSAELDQPTGQAAPRHVVAAERFMFSNLGNTITTRSVAAASGVSIRALFDGFRDFRQATPMQFLREARLDAARVMLQNGDRSVADVALACGFAHSGHFAKHYSKRFGEAPSWTRKFG